MLHPVLLPITYMIMYVPEEPGSEKLSDLPKVTQIVNSRTETHLGHSKPGAPFQHQTSG